MVIYGIASARRICPSKSRVVGHCAVAIREVAVGRLVLGACAACARSAPKRLAEGTYSERAVLLARALNRPRPATKPRKTTSSI
jgi:hypothetical protein